MNTTTAPANFTPDLEELNGELIGYSGPDIERPGFKVQRSWTAEDGLQMWIDHNQDEAFTVAEIQDLISVLTTVLQEHS